MKKPVRLKSFEQAPLIRKFSVLFLVVSVMPLVVLAYLLRISSAGPVNIEQQGLLFVMILLGCGILIGFSSMRRSILEIHKIARETGEAVLKDIPDFKIDVNDNEIKQLSRTFKEVTRNLENNIKRLEQSKRTLQFVLSKLATGISSLHNLDAFFDLIVEITASALEAKSAAIMLIDEGSQELFTRSVSGASVGFKDIRIKINDNGPGWVIKNRKPLFVPALNKQDDNTQDIFSPPFLCSPMIYQNRVLGVLMVSGKITGGSFGKDELLIVSNLAGQTAIAIENERLNQDAERTYLETVSALAMAVEARDPYSRGHLDRVSQYAVDIAKKMNLSEDLIKDIKDAAELHDVGKIGIGDDILKKPAPLNSEEEEMMRKHPIIGEGIVKPLRSLSRLSDIIRHHHEYLDGTGYPDGLKGDQIPIGARVLLVADSFDAITTDRPYSLKLTFEKAKEELKKYAGIRYDKKVVDAFLGII